MTDDETTTEQTTETTELPRLGLTEEAAKQLRAPFPEEQIGKLPRKTKSGGTIHLDFVGHAHVTDRLLDVDPYWSWEPFAVDPETGEPKVRYEFGTDDDGNAIVTRAVLWGRLTVCGVTRPGVGIVAGDKDELEKELVSDLLRNAGMRFGIALDLWAKEPLASQMAAEAQPAPERYTDDRHEALAANLKALREHGQIADETWAGFAEAYGRSRWPLDEHTLAEAERQVAGLIANGAERSSEAPESPSEATGTADPVAEAEDRLRDLTGAGTQPERGHEGGGFENWSAEEVTAYLGEQDKAPKIRTKRDAIKWLRDHGVAEFDEAPF